MKALAIRQPFAWLIVNGHKDIENRSWPTSYRGQVFIHASQSLARNLDDIFDFCDELGIELPDKVDCGGIVGVAEIVDCVTNSDSPWFGGPYGFVLKNARPLSFREFKGQLKFFETGLTLDDFRAIAFGNHAANRELARPESRLQPGFTKLLSQKIAFFTSFWTRNRLKP